MLLVSIDGLGGGFLEQPLAEGALPNWALLESLGAFTHNARTDATYPFTLPAHTSILTGRPVEPVEGLPETAHHGYTGNFPPGPDETLHNSGNPALPYLPSVFDVLHASGKRSCLYAGKAKFSIFWQSYGDSPPAPPYPEGAPLAHFFANSYDSATLVATVTEDLAAGLCDFAFVHLVELDPQAHDVEWGSSAWNELLASVDAWLGNLRDALEQTGGLGQEWGLVITADHGGTGQDHFDATALETCRIPFGIIGPGIPPGQDLYSLTQGARKDPGNSCPEYTAPNQPIRNGDAASVVLSLMGLPPVPGAPLGGWDPSP